jgi:CarboxypepD_reg-like domain
MNFGFPRPFWLTIFAGLLSFNAQSQQKYFSITGKVIDEKTRQPLAGASVFCQNTTIGTISNNDGNFSLRLAAGGYDLVVSYTGYETMLMRVGKGNKEIDSMSIELKEEDKNLGEVVVAGSAEVADGWDKYGKFFLDNFIGTTPNAAGCTLNNKEAVHFYFYKKRNKLKVKAKDVINITNNALGYTIKYQLDSFVYDYNTNVSSYTGYPLFEEMTGTPEQQAGWKKSRFSSYIGSRLHFIRSWYDSTLTEEGFVLEWADSSNPNKFSLLKDPYDSTIYSVDSGDAEITLNGRLRVSYTNQVPDKKYLEEHKFPLTTRVQISAIDIINGFVIEENGYFYDQSDVTNIGYWSWKKLAEVLPYDYVPDQP